MEGLVNKGRLDAETSRRLDSLITWAPGAAGEYALFRHCDLVVEAVVEDLAVKRDVFRRLEESVSEHCLLASNTSSLAITAIAGTCRRPERVIGLHFFNPVPVMSLVEVVRAPETSDATVQRALSFCAEVGKETIEVRDLPGFVTTRLGCILMCEAIRAFQDGVASPADIDTGMRLGYNHPVGPLALADRIGLDTLLSILDDLRIAYGDAYRAPATLRQLVAAGRLGRKSGRGFYEY
jgi:3-hydroxybutyryl-CoA dehydrogenase